MLIVEHVSHVKDILFIFGYSFLISMCSSIDCCLFLSFSYMILELSVRGFRI